MRREKALREHGEEGSASDSIQVLLWSNTFTDLPYAHVGLPVSSSLHKASSSSGMFWSAAMSPGGTGR